MTGHLRNSYIIAHMLPITTDIVLIALLKHNKIYNIDQLIKTLSIISTLIYCLWNTMS